MKDAAEKGGPIPGTKGGGEILSDHRSVCVTLDIGPAALGIGFLNTLCMTWSKYLVGRGPYAGTQIAIEKPIYPATGELASEAAAVEAKQVAWIVDLVTCPDSSSGRVPMTLLGVAEASPRIIAKLRKALDPDRYYFHWASTDSIKADAMNTWNSDCRLIICDTRAWKVEFATTFTWRFIGTDGKPDMQHEPVLEVSPVHSPLKRIVFSPVHLPWSLGSLDGPRAEKAGARPSLQPWLSAFLRATSFSDGDKVFGGDFNFEQLDDGAMKDEVCRSVGCPVPCTGASFGLFRCSPGATIWCHNEKRPVTYDALYMMRAACRGAPSFTPAPLHPNDVALLDCILSYKGPAVLH